MQQMHKYHNNPTLTESESRTSLTSIKRKIQLELEFSLKVFLNVRHKRGQILNNSPSICTEAPIQCERFSGVNYFTFISIQNKLQRV